MSKELFPNGLESYLETFFEMATQMLSIAQCEHGDNLLTLLYEREGRMGIQSLAKEFTDEFEHQFTTKDFEEFDYYETIEQFISSKI
jgi:hypothetical protein